MERTAHRGMAGVTLGNEVLTDLDFADDVALLAEMLEVRHSIGHFVSEMTYTVSSGTLNSSIPYLAEMLDVLVLAMTIMQEEAAVFGLKINWSKNQNTPGFPHPCFAQQSRWQMDMLKWSAPLFICHDTVIMSVRSKLFVLSGLHAQLGGFLISLRVLINFTE